ncbi:nuclear pore complex assembly-domain-containing protein [Rhodofomes roseus]|uniref:Nuclear pore complex assembly-domain-containing protein n=1 Tax=Rhodofomes roseus TaxID=34475 RepID=A0ABQ8K969_9APHY|nr:nuclear pore complex assembly-domain-containing protein [Rhodofomes roseus]KAH9833296.1 nuclear pore complex assembly-domain-containing protein [Rhodofomes roseus]
MDVDIQDEAAGLLALFETGPETFAWRDPIPREMEEQRVRMSDTLIFDILLAEGGIRHASSLYPPTDAESLHRLLEAICNSTYDAVKQDSLIYFLLKWHKDGREMDFSESRCIQPQFVILADAYWHLDTGINVERAVSLLSDQRLNGDYISKIIQALSLSDNPHTCIRNYVHTVQPLLTEPRDMDAYAIALADSSLMDAWHYQRTFSERSPSRPRLVRKILDFCLTPKPRLPQLKALLALHLTAYEQSLLHNYAIDPPQKLSAASVSTIQDLACLRHVQSGEYAAAIKLDRQLPPGGMVAKDRRQMMDDLMASMPLVERQLLEVELEQLTAAPRPSVSVSQSWTNKATNSTDLSMSWESVRNPSSSTATKSAPTAAAAAHKSNGTPSMATPTISQKSGAPRFGAPLGATPHTEMFAPLSFPSSASTASPGASAFAPSMSVGRVPLIGPTTHQQTPSSAGRPSASSARPGSLFEIAGSANQAPNAFYTPPQSISAGAKRPFGQDTPRTPRASASPQRPEPVSAASAGATTADGDITMQTDEDAIAADLADITQTDASRVENTAATEDEESPTAEFSTSIFGRNRSTSADIPRVSARRLRQEKSDSPFIPGAFGPTTDDEGERERISMPPPPPPATTSRKSRASGASAGSASARRRVSPSPPPAPRPARATRANSNARRKDLRQSIPGGFMDEEEDDDVPPLPPPTPTTRKGIRKPRASKANERDEMTAEELTRPTRRSTRLSTAPSVGESSPEPASPTKPSTKARSTRKSTAAATGAPARSSRKKR